MHWSKVREILQLPKHSNSVTQVTNRGSHIIKTTEHKHTVLCWQNKETHDPSGYLQHNIDWYYVLWCIEYRPILCAYYIASRIQLNLLPHSAHKGNYMYFSITDTSFARKWLTRLQNCTTHICIHYSNPELATGQFKGQPDNKHIAICSTCIIISFNYNEHDLVKWSRSFFCWRRYLSTVGYNILWQWCYVAQAFQWLMYWSTLCEIAQQEKTIYVA